MNFFDNNSITSARAATSSVVSSALIPKNTSAKITSSSSSDVGSASSSSTASITSDDFLTLLVSELKNQDPTQPTDPNAYIQQLVGVNSLQQLIQINQGLSTIEPTVPATGQNAISGTPAG